MRKLPKRFRGGAGRILKGFGDLVDKLGELAKTGEQLSRTGEIHGANKELKGIYGVNVKVGLGDDRPVIQPFGNLRHDKESGTPWCRSPRARRGCLRGRQPCPWWWPRCLASPRKTCTSPSGDC